jgi:hypothetical protein
MTWRRLEFLRGNLLIQIERYNLIMKMTSVVLLMMSLAGAAT